jgi:hypothetical protein
VVICSSEFFILGNVVSGESGSKTRKLVVAKDQSTEWVVKLIDSAANDNAKPRFAYQGLALCPVGGASSFSLRLEGQVNTCMASTIALDVVLPEASEFAVQVNGKDCQPRLSSASSAPPALAQIRANIDRSVVGRPKCMVDLYFNNADPRLTFLPLELSAAEPSPVIRQRWTWGVSFPALAFHLLFWMAACLGVFAAQAYFDIITRSTVLRLLISLTPMIAATLAALRIEWIKFRADAFPNWLIRRVGIARWACTALFLMVAIVAGGYDWLHIAKQAEVIRVRAVKAQYAQLIESYFERQDPKYLYDAFELVPWRAEAHLLLIKYARRGGVASSNDLPAVVFNDRVLAVIRSKSALDTSKHDVMTGSLDGVEDPCLWLASLLPEIETSQPNIPLLDNKQNYKVNAIVLLASTGLDSDGEGSLYSSIMRNELASIANNAKLPNIPINPQQDDFFIVGIDNNSIHKSFLALNELRALIYQDSATTPPQPIPYEKRLSLIASNLSASISAYESAGNSRTSTYYMEALDHLAQNYLALAAIASMRKNIVEENLRISQTIDLYKKMARARTNALRERRMQWFRGPEKLVLYKLLTRPKVFEISRTSTVESQYAILKSNNVWSDYLKWLHSSSGEYSLDDPENWYIGTIEESRVINRAPGSRITNNTSDFISEMLKNGWRY